MVLNETGLTEGVNFKSRHFCRLICDRDHVQIMLFQKDAAIYIVPISAKFFFDDELGHIEHDLGAELMDLEKFNDRL